MVNRPVRLGVGPWGTLSDEDGSVICNAITQWLQSRRTHYQILLPPLRLPQPGGLGPRIYIPQKQGGPVITPGTGFPFRCLLQLTGLCRKYSNPPPHGVSTVKVKAKVILRLTVSQPVRPGVGHPSGTRDQFFFLLEIFFRQLRVCYFVAPSLTRGQVCNLLLLLVLASAVPLRSESHGTQDHILLSQFLRSPNLEDQVPVFISPRNRVALSVASYNSQSYGGGILSCLHVGILRPSQSQSHVTNDGQSVSQSVSQYVLV
jgi:hypothetical protein